MQAVSSVLVFVTVLVVASAGGASTNTASPIDKIIKMLSDLEGKITVQDHAAQAEYSAYAAWCSTQQVNLEHEIAIGKQHIEEYSASIEHESSDISVSITIIDESTAAIALYEHQLAEATAIRDKEASDFAAETQELKEVIDTLERAIAILEREQRKHDGASMLQTELQRAHGIADALKVMVNAAAFSAADAARLTSLVQSSQSSDDSDNDAELGAPEAATYKFSSGGIIETLEGLLEKAQEQLADSQKREQDAAHAFQLLVVSLKGEIAVSQKSIVAAKIHISQSKQEKATSTGDLSVTKADLAEDMKALAQLHIDCILAAKDFDAGKKSRADELAAIAEAKRIIQRQTSGAESVVYDSSLSQMSFAQISSSTGSRLSSSADLVNFEVVRFVRDLSRKQDSPELAQLASKIASAMRTGGEKDVFAKVKGLIRDLIAHLEAQRDAEADHHAWCQKETSEATSKSEEKSDLIAKLKTQMDQMKASSTQLKQDVATLQQELAELSSSQLEMDNMRREEKATFQSNSADLDQGIQGVRMALKVLREYYDKNEEGSAQGASTGIIALLEVVESDFSKALAQMKSAESAAQRDYDVQTQLNVFTKAAKDKDIQYKTKEFTAADKKLAELTSDLESTQMELSAVLESLDKLDKICIARPMPYEERKRRREAEIAGLQEALEILQGEVVLLQKRNKRAQKALRGKQQRVIE
jgi:cell division protein FtsB